MSCVHYVINPFHLRPANKTCEKIVVQQVSKEGELIIGVPKKTIQAVNPIPNLSEAELAKLDLIVIFVSAQKQRAAHKHTSTGVFGTDSKVDIIHSWVNFKVDIPRLFPTTQEKNQDYTLLGYQIKSGYSGQVIHVQTKGEISDPDSQYDVVATINSNDLRKSSCQ